MNITPSGHEFRKFINNWQQYTNIFREDDEKSGKAARVHLLVNGRDFIMFFVHKDDIFASNEDSRLTFATMMDDKEPGTKDMSFGATNLSALLKGKDSVGVFRYKDLPQIKIIPPEKAEEKLLDKPQHKTEEIPERLEIARKHQKGHHGLNVLGDQ